MTKADKRAALEELEASVRISISDNAEVSIGSDGLLVLDVEQAVEMRDALSKAIRQIRGKI